MNNSEFWRSLANDFQSARSGFDFTAYRTYFNFKGQDSSTPRWTLPAEKFVLAEFDALARRGATKLANAPASNLTVVWLEALWEEATTGPVRQAIDIVARDEAAGIMHLRGTIQNVLRASATLCRKFEAEAVQSEFERLRQIELQERIIDSVNVEGPIDKQQSIDNKRFEPKALRDRYLAHFPEEKIKIRDICWAAGQHYREWKRWLAGELKDGSTPDLAFRRVLTSGKRPAELKKLPRPSKWE